MEAPDDDDEPEPLDGDDPADEVALPVCDAVAPEVVPVAVDPAPVTVKTPPEGAAARHASAALDASVAVLGAARRRSGTKNQHMQHTEPSDAHLRFLTAVAFPEKSQACGFLD